MQYAILEGGCHTETVEADSGEAALTAWAGIYGRTLEQHLSAYGMMRDEVEALPIRPGTPAEIAAAQEERRAAQDAYGRACEEGDITATDDERIDDALRRIRAATRRLIALGAEERG